MKLIYYLCSFGGLLGGMYFASLHPGVDSSAITLSGIVGWIFGTAIGGWLYVNI
jgi:hypothetical protein